MTLLRLCARSCGLEYQLPISARSSGEPLAAVSADTLNVVVLGGGILDRGLFWGFDLRQMIFVVVVLFHRGEGESCGGGVNARSK